MPKPHRVVLDRVSGYADEAAAFMRRRRHVRRPFARVYRADGSSVDHAADEAAAALRGDRSEPVPLRAQQTARQEIRIPPDEVAADRKAQMLRELDDRARSQGDEIVQVQVNYGESHRQIVVANSAGTYASD